VRVVQVQKLLSETRPSPTKAKKSLSTSLVGCICFKDVNKDVFVTSMEAQVTLPWEIAVRAFEEPVIKLTQFEHRITSKPYFHRKRLYEIFTISN